MVGVSVALALVTSLGLAAQAFALARAARVTALSHLPAASAGLLVWGAGVLLAFAAASHALRRDRDEGIVHLFEARGAGAAYLRARVLGLAALLFVVLGGGVLVVGVASMAAAQRYEAAGLAFASTCGSLLYAFASSVTVAVVAFAALGARTRGGGYLRLLVALSLPEVFAYFLSSSVSASWVELLSIPSALAALRLSLAPGEVDLPRFLRAFAVLLTVCAVAWGVARRELSLVTEDSL
jgi:hypothetical protein